MKEKESFEAVLGKVGKMSLDEIRADLDLLEPEQVAKMLKIGRSTVYHFANKGLLPAFKIGTLVRFRPRALYVFILKKEKESLGVNYVGVDSNDQT